MQLTSDLRYNDSVVKAAAAFGIVSAPILLPTFQSAINQHKLKSLQSIFELSINHLPFYHIGNSKTHSPSLIIHTVQSAKPHVLPFAVKPLDYVVKTVSL